MAQQDDNNGRNGISKPHVNPVAQSKNDLLNSTANTSGTPWRRDNIGPAPRDKDGKCVTETGPDLRSENAYEDPRIKPIYARVAVDFFYDFYDARKKLGIRSHADYIMFLFKLGDKLDGCVQKLRVNDITPEKHLKVLDKAIESLLFVNKSQPMPNWLSLEPNSRTDEDVSA